MNASGYFILPLIIFRKEHNLNTYEKISFRFGLAEPILLNSKSFLVI